MNPWIDPLAAWLVDFYVTSSLLLFMLAACLALVRQPARRIALCWPAVVGLFALAVFSSLPNRPRLPLPSSLRPIVSVASFDQLKTQDEDVQFDSRSETAELPPAATSEEEKAFVEADLTASQISSEPDARRFDELVRSALAMAFVAGAAIVAGWLLVGAALTARLRRTSRLAPRPVQQLVARMLDTPRVKTRVLTSDHVGQALAFGVVEPHIVLPTRFLGNEPCEALNAVLAHESAHVRNGDLRMLACLRLLMPLLFAHPLYWWLRSRIRLDQELLADAAASRQGDVADYAAMLLDWFRANDTQPAPLFTASLGFWERPHRLKRRIAMLLNDQIPVEPTSSRPWQLAGWLSSLVIVAGLSLVSLRGPQPLLADEPADAVSAPASKPLNSAEAAQPEFQPANVPQESGEGQVAVDAPAADPKEDAAPKKDASEAKDKTKEPAPVIENNTGYQSAEEAWTIGVAYYNSRNFAASRKPFEAALKLAPNDAFRLKVYEALQPSYRLQSKIDDMVTACDFILRHTESAAKKSITRRMLLSFVHERGKADALIKQYEKVLADDPHDVTALYVLSEAYERLKDNDARAAELTRRLLEVEGGSGDRPLDVATSAQLAGQLVRQKKYREGAELYEKIAPLDAGLAAWHWKEAAAAWLKLDESAKALAAAKKSVEAGPEKRSQLLTHFWHRALGEVFLATGEPKQAVTHLQAAIDNTNIEGYRNDCQNLLRKAEQASQ